MFRGRLLRSIATSASDFDHHSSRVARLNHGSFGACPRPVLDAQEEFRREWLAHPDGYYFTGKLQEGIAAAADAAATVLAPNNGAGIDASSQVCLVENATVAAVAVAKRWSKALGKLDVSGPCLVFPRSA